jgi:hypothetical protein
LRSADPRTARGTADRSAGGLLLSAKQRHKVLIHVDLSGQPPDEPPVDEKRGGDRTDEHQDHQNRYNSGVRGSSKNNRYQHEKKDYQDEHNQQVENGSA